MNSLNYMKKKKKNGKIIQKQTEIIKLQGHYTLFLFLHIYICEFDSNELASGKKS